MTIKDQDQEGLEEMLLLVPCKVGMSSAFLIMETLVSLL